MPHDGLSQPAALADSGALTVPDGVRLLGLDIGGSRSRARLWTDGHATDAQAPSASLPAAGADGARAALGELIAALRLDPADPVDAICAGSAGLSIPGAREFLHHQLAPLARAGAITIVTDAMLVLPAAGLTAGIAVICGTASVAVGTDRGRSIQAGGWGYLLGDEGGGYWIVREALRDLLSRRDRGRPAGDLGSTLLSATSSADVAELQGQFYRQPHYPREWARLAELVLTSGDPAAAGIAARAAEALAGLAAAATRELGARLPVVLAGGLTANAAFAARVCRAVRVALPGADVRVLADEPVVGAIRLAALAAHSGS